MIKERKIYFLFLFYCHPGIGQIQKKKEVKEKAFKGEVEIDGFKKIYLYLKCILTYIRYSWENFDLKN